jgi:hypothetical protein
MLGGSFTSIFIVESKGNEGVSCFGFVTPFSNNTIGRKSHR